ncbi:hypothetical protein QJS10_CPB18g01239 [Acorus calamus]|uniref:Uncharacterized protein n=1 Tax=Acorus calamus TaxID=4465 RepID=A0AAV9CRP7_ACOCL|nr:hypothetical protein QJS10_CPB18g01239 [Acorus calamus]
MAHPYWSSEKINLLIWQDSPGIRMEWLKRDKDELDKILCGIVTYPSRCIRYVRIFMGNSHKVKWKEEMLSLVKDDINESLSAA